MVEMGKKFLKRIMYLFIAVVFCIVGFIVSLHTVFLWFESIQLKNYYSEKEVYVTVSGEVEWLNFGEDGLFLTFQEELTEPYEHYTFGIKGKSFDLLLEKNIKNRLHKGDKVEFMTAPRYFGDGFIMPIVSLTVNGEVLLEFEDGYANLLEDL